MPEARKMRFAVAPVEPPTPPGAAVCHVACVESTATRYCPADGAVAAATSTFVVADLRVVAGPLFEYELLIARLHWQLFKQHGYVINHVEGVRLVPLHRVFRVALVEEVAV